MVSRRYLFLCSPPKIVLAFRPDSLRDIHETDAEIGVRLGLSFFLRPGSLWRAHAMAARATTRFKWKHERGTAERFQKASA